MMDDGWMWGHGWGWGGGVLMTVVMALFLVALIVAIVMAIRYLGGSSPAPRESRPRPGPENVLAERFARGEIDEDEYRSRLSLLRLHR
ncbi:MAG: SHOCT domain-containing protein [Mycobacterium sp.]|jgi:putative membrane protein